MKELKTMAYSLGKISDCRDLFLEMEFHSLTKEKVIALCELCYQSTYMLLEDTFFTVWNWKSKKIPSRNILRKIAKSVKKDFPWIAFSFEGEVTSDMVYNLSTYYRHCLCFYPSQPGEKTLTGTGACMDYADWILPLLSSDISPEQYKEIVKEVFKVKGKHPQFEYWSHDTMGFFTAQRHEYSSELYYGDFKIRISYGCIESCVDSFAEKFTDILKQASGQVKNVSGRVGIRSLSGPGPYSSYMDYFGHDVLMDGSHQQMGMDAREWYPNYYFCGAEWFNLLSPLQLQHIPNIENDAKEYPELTLQRCANGGMILQLNKMISSIDIGDFIPIKKVLYNALYPGKNEFLLEHFCDPELWVYWAKPRCKWEYVPIFDEEIIVTDRGIVFQHLKHSTAEKNNTDM